MTEAANEQRWNGGPGHYEVWFMTTNHIASETGFWIRYTMDAPFPGHGDAYAQVWFAMFDARDPSRNVAIHQTLPIAAMTGRTGPFCVRIGDSELTHSSARGRISGAGHDVSWDLTWPPADRVHRHLPGVMYRRGGLGETTVLSPNLDVPASGTITCDGRAFELRNEPFGQSHIWGEKHAYEWAWGHCNAFGNRHGAALEILAPRLKRRGVVLPRLTIFTLYLDGEVFRFNEFHHTLLTRSEVGSTRFAFRARGLRETIEGEFSCRPEDMVVAPYMDPDGEPSYCANTEVADLRLTVYKRAGLTHWREHAQLLAPRSAHFEIAGRQRDPAISADHIEIT